MATVYLAIQENFEREVALKIMSPTLSEDSSFSERFLREARIVSRLVHPHIVTVHDVGIQNGHHYLSMEYIAGQDLKQRLPSLTGDQLFRVLREVASALDYAGRKGYVHRDVKPENIMLHADDGRAVLMDFGIARAADSASTMTRTGTALGTPHYMSPEQAKGDPIDGRSDLYSLGVLLYYMITGKVPYEADSAVAIGIKHLTAPIPVLPDALITYQPIINKLMAKSPDDRYQAGYELIDDVAGVDLDILNQWRPQQNIEYLTSHEYTPQRSVQVTSKKGGGHSSMGSYLPSARRDKLADEAVDKTVLSPLPSSSLQSPVNQPPSEAEVQHARQSPQQPREAITIPKEDLRERTPAPTSSFVGSSVFVIIIVIIGLSIGAAYYFKDPLAKTALYKTLVTSVGFDPLENLIEQTTNTITLPNSTSVEGRERESVAENNNSERGMANSATFENTSIQENKSLLVPGDSDQVMNSSVESTTDNDLSSEAIGTDIEGQSDNLSVDADTSLASASYQDMSALLQRSRELAMIVQEQPAKTDELLTLYRQILSKQPEQQEVIDALAQIKSEALVAVSLQIDSGNTQAAEQSLRDAVAWFPALEKEDRYLSLEKRIAVTAQVKQLLGQGNDYLSRDRLIRPASDNARDSFAKVLELDPGNEKAQKGLQRIVGRYFKLADLAKRKSNLKKAKALIESGLSVNASDRRLLSLRKKINAAIERERKISSLLVQAQVMESQQNVFGDSQSAAAHYQSILAIDPRQIDAKQALEQLFKNLFSQVDTFVAEKDYEQAITLVEAARITLPDNTRLQSKLQQLNRDKPAIANLVLSGLPIASNAKANPAEKISADRTLHIAFTYRGLEQGATVLQALLFDGARSVQIAAVPVVVTGGSGGTQFRVDRPVEGFTDGGYHLDILLAGKRVFTNSFVIAR